jgi:UDP-N-acetylglucosamine transferase subunit ALG13
VIFATVGSHPTYRFQRLLDALECVPGEDLVVQYGPGDPPPHPREAIDFMSFEQILEHMRRASAVISHAGVGTILCALEAGHVPVVMAREARFGETVDDHQVAFARALAPSGRIALVGSGDELAAAVREAAARDAGTRGAVPIGEATGLVDAVRAELRAPGEPTRGPAGGDS